MRSFSTHREKVLMSFQRGVARSTNPPKAKRTELTPDNDELTSSCSAAVALLCSRSETGVALLEFIISDLSLVRFLVNPQPF